MNKEFIPYQQALALRELGFDEPCFKAYFKYTRSTDLSNKIELSSPLSNIYGEGYLFKNSDDFFIDRSISGDGDGAKCSAPLYQQAFHWLLEKHNLYGIIIPTVTMAWTFKTMTTVTGMVEVPPYSHVGAYDYSSREEAEQACLEKLIELVKNK